MDKTYYLPIGLSQHMRIAKRCRRETEEDYVGTPGLKSLSSKGKNVLYALLFHDVRKSDPEHAEKLGQILLAIRLIAPQDSTCKKVLDIWSNIH